MDQEVKARWLEALRSGTFKQGVGQLESNGCNCCLGVLCRVENFELHEDSEPHHVIFTFPDGKSNFGFLSDGTFGLSHTDQWTLAQMNDAKVPFEKIAVYIEKNL